MVIRDLKDDIVIKAEEEKLRKHLSDLDTLPYPFSFIKADKNDGYMLCNSSSCFGHEADWKGVVKVVEDR
jgi:hypothetical protein